MKLFQVVFVLFSSIHFVDAALLRLDQHPPNVVPRITFFLDQIDPDHLFVNLNQMGRITAEYDVGPLIQSYKGRSFYGNVTTPLSHGCWLSPRHLACHLQETHTKEEKNLIWGYDNVQDWEFSCENNKCDIEYSKPSLIDVVISTFIPS